MTLRTEPSTSLVFEDAQLTHTFPGFEAELVETGCRAVRELERVRNEHGGEAVHAAAYALIVAAVGHYATACGLRTTQQILQLLADNIGENISPRPRLDS